MVTSKSAFLSSLPSRMQTPTPSLQHFWTGKVPYYQMDKINKVIAQTYDEATVMRRSTGGVQRKIMDVYKNAHYVYCYQLNLIIQQATKVIPRICTFFTDLGGFSAFFSRSSKRIAVFDRVVAHRLPRVSTTRRNFQSRCKHCVRTQG